MSSFRLLSGSQIMQVVNQRLLIILLSLRYKQIQYILKSLVYVRWKFVLAIRETFTKTPGYYIVQLRYYQCCRLVCQWCQWSLGVILIAVWGHNRLDHYLFIFTTKWVGIYSIIKITVSRPIYQREPAYSKPLMRKISTGSNLMPWCTRISF